MRKLRRAGCNGCSGRLTSCEQLSTTVASILAYSICTQSSLSNSNQPGMGNPDLFCKEAAYRQLWYGCSVGCSDFNFFSHFAHPWHPKGPRIWKLAKKNFQFHPWPAEILANRKMRFFCMISKFNFRSPIPFFQHVSFIGSLIHIQNFRSLSQKLWSQENGQDRVQNISVCKVWKVNFI